MMESYQRSQPDPRAARIVTLAVVGLVIGSASVASAAQTTITISMTPPGAAPRILGPQSIAAKPGSPVLYTIPVTGAKPFTYAARGLPTGLALNATTGTLSGTAPAAGSYPITVTVQNAMGSSERAMSLVAGNTLAITPPMGWNSYDSYGSSVTEAEVLAAARAELAQLQPFGWNLVVVDYLWFDPEQRLDANGRFLPSLSKFPSATGTLGLKPLADQIHAMGLSFGLHIMRGIPRKTVTANSPILGTTPAATATAAANTSDACPWNSDMWGVNGASAAGQAWYDSIFAQYAAWGVDFIKVDDMINNALVPLVYHQPEVQAIRSAIDKTGRSIVFSLSPGPMQPANAVSLNANANMWRMVNDFWDANGNSTLPDVFAASAVWQAVSGLSVGHWPDADMLPLGYLGPRVPSFVHPSGPTALSHNEQVSVMSLWAILPSPLMFGGNVPMLTTDATGPWTLALLTNDEVIAVNQDTGGARGKLVAQSGTTQAWAKNLSDGRKAVALFNRGNADAPVSVTWAQLGLTDGVALSVRDLWRRADLGPMTNSVTVTVPWLGASLLALSPASTPSDGGVDSGSGAGDDGSTGAAGNGATGGGSGLGGSAGTGGSAGATAGGTGTGGGAGAVAGGGGATGGAVGSPVGTGGVPGGAAGRGGTAAPGVAGGTSSGCGCEIGRQSSHGQNRMAGILLSMALATSLTAVRKRRRRISRD